MLQTPPISILQVPNYTVFFKWVGRDSNIGIDALVCSLISFKVFLEGTDRLMIFNTMVFFVLKFQILNVLIAIFTPIMYKSWL